jgi:PcaR/PcaU/PobR family beta-ketoadipate pathway transcriptional regulator
MSQGPYLIEALARGLDVLSLFSRERPTLSLTQITDAARLNKTTAFRILSTLEAAGYLQRDSETKKYRPGLKVLKLGFTAISSLEFRQVARPYLEHLSQQVGETVSLSVLDGMEVVYVDRIRNQQIVGVVLGLGSRIPAHCGSMGKAILAYLPDDDLARRLREAELRPCTPYSKATPEALVTELAQIRRQGYALNIEELEVGLLAVAAPIFDHQQVVAAINVTGSTRTISRERLVDELAPLVRSTAGQISQALGYSGED